MIILNGIAFCEHCVRKLGDDRVKAFNQPGILNLTTGVRHLNPNKRDLTTLCGLKTNNQNWQEPYRVTVRHMQADARRWRKQMEAREAEVERAKARLSSGVGSP